jgi:hypothetical protein
MHHSVADIDKPTTPANRFVSKGVMVMALQEVSLEHERISKFFEAKDSIPKT